MKIFNKRRGKGDREFCPTDCCQTGGGQLLAHRITTTENVWEPMRPNVFPYSNTQIAPRQTPVSPPHYTNGLIGRKKKRIKIVSLNKKHETQIASLIDMSL